MILKYCIFSIIDNLIHDVHNRHDDRIHGFHDVHNRHDGRDYGHE